MLPSFFYTFGKRRRSLIYQVGFTKPAAGWPWTLISHGAMGRVLSTPNVVLSFEAEWVKWVRVRGHRQSWDAETHYLKAKPWRTSFHSLTNLLGVYLHPPHDATNLCGHVEIGCVQTLICTDFSASCASQLGFEKLFFIKQLPMQKRS